MESFKPYQCQNIVASGHTTQNMSRMMLLRWINDETVGIKIKKVEDLCTGAAYCQLIERMFPGCISLKKVVFEASQPTEFWKNFKLLQMAFRAVGCEKDVPIDTLIKGRFQDNFEFLQWFKRFYDANAEVSSASKTPNVGTVPKSIPTARSANTNANIIQKEDKVVRELKSKIAEYQGKAEKVMEEKDFYFSKLRNIEILCTAEDAATTDKETMVNKILAELYATAEGFESPEENE